MDADYDGSQNLQSELIESAKKKRKRRRSKFAMIIAKEKPKFDPKQFPLFGEYFDKYYSLDYEDMIGDIPCRFKYRKVTPNAYGLSVEEILMADNKELEKWCKLKEVTGYKSESKEMQEIRSYKQRASDEMLKRKILKSLYNESEEQEDEAATAEKQTTNNISKKKRRKMKKIKNNNFNANSTNTNTISEERIAKSIEVNTQNNSHDIKNDAEQNKNTEEKSIVNNSNKRKRENKLKVDGDSPRPKMIKTDDVKESSPVKADKKIEKDNEKTVSMDKTVVNKRKKNKMKEMRKLQFNKLKSDKHKSSRDNIDPIMSLNAERLKTYGINAKKFKNKLKYGKKKC